MVSAATLTVTIPTNFACGRYQQTNITGLLKLDGSSVNNGLVAVQINKPDGNVLTLRTVNTGTNPTSPNVDIKNVSCTDFERNPVSNVAKGSQAYFTVFVENKASQLRHVVYNLDIYDNTNTPIGHSSGSQDLEPNSIIGATFPIEIQTWVSDGRATVFASAYTTLPEENGTPYCPEKSSVFTIANQQGASPPSTPTGSQGNYYLAIRVPKNAQLDRYTIYISSTYNSLSAYGSGYFDVFQPGDLSPLPSGDGVVNSADIAAFVNAYIRYYAGSPYDKRADMDQNDVMNSNDITSFVNAYIVYYSW
jgi:hypothetical protein